MVQFAGDDKFFIGSDYPHAEGFVDPVRTARERLSSLPVESVDKVLCVNARKFYRIGLGPVLPTGILGRLLARLMAAEAAAVKERRSRLRATFAGHRSVPWLFCTLRSVMCRNIKTLFNFDPSVLRWQGT